MSATPLTCIVGGDKPTRLLLRFVLSSEGCTVCEAADVDSVGDAIDLSEVALFLVVAEQCAELPRLSALRHAPTIVIGYNVTAEFRRRASAHGAADVIGLPADTRALQARLHTAVYSRTVDAPTADAPPILRAGGLMLDMVTRKLFAEGGTWVHLTPQEARLLCALMAKPGKPVGHHTLLDHVWDASYSGDPAALDVYVCRVRAKLARLAGPRRYIHTVFKAGYRFEARSTDRMKSDGGGDRLPTVLVIDDDPEIVNLVRETLAAEGYAVAHGLDRNALILARQLQPAVILLDLIMPGLDALEICRELRQNPRTAGIPIIVVSAGHNLRTHVERMDVADYLAKPFDPDELLLRVNKWAHPAISRRNNAVKPVIGVDAAVFGA